MRALSLKPFYLIVALSLHPLLSLSIYLSVVHTHLSPSWSQTPVRSTDPPTSLSLSVTSFGQKHRSTHLSPSRSQAPIRSTDPQLRSTTPIHSCTDPQLRLGSDPQASICLASIRQDPYPRAPIKRDPLAPVKQDPWAPIVPVKHRSNTDRSDKHRSVSLLFVCLGLFVWVCLCISFSFFLFFEQVYLCVDFSVWMCLCVGVFVCIWGKRRRWGKEKLLSLLSLLSTEKREKKGREREMNKIINERVTVVVYISMVTVARVEIYTFLHNFRNTDVEHFWVKMCKKSYFLYFARLSMDRCGCSNNRNK